MEVPQYIVIPCYASASDDDNDASYAENVDEIVPPTNVIALMTLSKDEKRQSIQRRWEEGESSSGDRDKQSPKLPRRSWTKEPPSCNITEDPYNAVAGGFGLSVATRSANSPPRKPRRRPPLTEAYSFPFALQRGGEGVRPPFDEKFVALHTCRRPLSEGDTKVASYFGKLGRSRSSSSSSSCSPFSIPPNKCCALEA